MAALSFPFPSFFWTPHTALRVWAGPVDRAASAEHVRVGLGRDQRFRSRLASFRKWVAVSYCNFAYSALACFRMGMSGSASFHNVRKF
jgi:hypothetical protein